MITEDYVSFETAKMLKEKGFDESCQNLYRKTHEILSCGAVNLPELTNSQLDNLKNLQVWIDKMFVHTCPTLQMAMKWLREVHNIVCNIDIESRNFYCYSIFIIRNSIEAQYQLTSQKPYFETYEEACEEAIKYCLKNLI